MDKVFKTYDEQIALLNSRGIEISTSIERSDAKKALQHYGYYNLINGYKISIDISITDIYQVWPITVVDLTPDISINNKFQIEFAI